MQVEQEKEYQIMPTTDGNLVFAIRAKSGEIKDPKILYNGGKHAVLYRNDEDVVILDHLHPGAVTRLQKLSKAFISEIDYENESVKHFYPVHIHQVFKFPFDIEAYM